MGEHLKTTQKDLRTELNPEPSVFPTVVETIQSGIKSSPPPWFKRTLLLSAQKPLNKIKCIIHKRLDVQQEEEHHETNLQSQTAMIQPITERLPSEINPHR